MSERNAGRVAMIYRGDWSPNPSEDYTILDIVSYGGNTYCLYKIDTSYVKTNPPSASDSENYWFKLAQKGGDLSIGGVVATYNLLPTASAELHNQIYFVQDTEKLYYCQLSGTTYSWIEMCTIQQPSTNFYSGAGVPTIGADNTINYHIGDIYLNYLTSILYKRITNGTGRGTEEDWIQHGTLSGIAYSINGTDTIPSSGWTTESSTFVYTTAKIEGLKENDSPIIGLQQGAANSLIDKWNYIYKAEVAARKDDTTDPTKITGYGIKFYASTQPGVNLPYQYVVYTFSEKELYNIWSNPVISIDYNDGTTPTAAVTLNESSVNFDFSIPKEKFIAEAVGIDAEQASASFVRYNDSWKLNLGIPRSNGEGRRGKAATIQAGDASLEMIEEGSTPEVTVENVGNEHDAEFDFDFKIPYTCKTFSVYIGTNQWSSGAATLSSDNFKAGGYVYFVSHDRSSSGCKNAQLYADSITTDGKMVVHCVGTTPTSWIYLNISRVECATQSTKSLIINSSSGGVASISQITNDASITISGDSSNVQLGHPSLLTSVAASGFRPFSVNTKGHITSVGSTITPIEDPDSKSVGQILKYTSSGWTAQDEQGKVTSVNSRIGAVTVSKASTASIPDSSGSWVQSGNVYTITVNCENVTTAATLVVGPAPEYIGIWCNANLRATGQASGKITFTCDSIPTAAIVANVLIEEVE